jgi:hypothetical protein
MPVRGQTWLAALRTLFPEPTATPLASLSRRSAEQQPRRVAPTHPRGTDAETCLLGGGSFGWRVGSRVLAEGRSANDAAMPAMASG